jgi:hypothetical protein
MELKRVHRISKIFALVTLLLFARDRPLVRLLRPLAS